MWNPVRVVLKSSSPRGVKIIALNLMLVLVCALPVMILSCLNGDESKLVLASWLFAIGAMIAHIGFFVGVVLLIWDAYFAKK